MEIIAAFNEANFKLKQKTEHNNANLKEHEAIPLSKIRDHIIFHNVMTEA